MLYVQSTADKQEEQEEEEKEEEEEFNRATLMAISRIDSCENMHI